MHGMTHDPAEAVTIDGTLPASVTLRTRLRRAAAEARLRPVFLAGEPGSGRQHAARVLHADAGGGWFRVLHGAARDARAQLAAALADASGPGTLYIDRVHDLPPEAQRDLLAALRGGLPPDLRLVTSQPLPRAGAPAGPALSDDLRFLLEAVVVPIPPLRDRAGDVPAIAAAMLAEFARAEGGAFGGVSDAVAAVLRGHSWPGNLRELANVMRSVVLMHDAAEVTPEMLPPTLTAVRADLPAPSPLDALLQRPLAEIERWVIETVIAREDGSIPRAARALGISPSTIYRKIEAWDRTAAEAATDTHPDTPDAG